MNPPARSRSLAAVEISRTKPAATAEKTTFFFTLSSSDGMRFL
jgi:hypothetical protein